MSDRDKLEKLLGCSSDFVKHYKEEIGKINQSIFDISLETTYLKNDILEEKEKSIMSILHKLMFIKGKLERLEKHNTELYRDFKTLDVICYENEK